MEENEESDGKKHSWLRNLRQWTGIEDVEIIFRRGQIG